MVYITHPFTVIATSDKEGATRMPQETLCCYCNGRLWVFYSTDTMRKVASTKNGIDWIVSDFRYSGHGGSDFSIIVDDTGFFHYVYAYGTSWGGESPKYRMGYLMNDGTIYWMAAEVTIAINNDDCNPQIVTDSDGYPWVSFYSTNTGSPKIPSYVYKSSTKNGTWNTASGFPYDPSQGLAYTTYLIVLCPMNNNRMMIIYATQSDDGTIGSLYSRLWDGSSWGVQKTVASNICHDTWGKINARAIGDEVIVSWYGKDTVNCTGTGKGIFWNKWTGSDWLYPAVTPSSSYMLVCDIQNSNPALTKTADNKMLLFWMANYRIWFKEYSNGVWSDAVEWFYDPSMDNVSKLGYSTINSSFKENSNNAGKINCIYRSNLASPYNIMHGYLVTSSFTFCSYMNEHQNFEGAGFLDSVETVFEVIDSYILQAPIIGTISAIATLAETMQAIDYYLGFYGADLCVWGPS